MLLSCQMQDFSVFMYSRSHMITMHIHIKFPIFNMCLLFEVLCIITAGTNNLMLTSNLNNHVTVECLLAGSHLFLPGNDHLFSIK